MFSHKTRRQRETYQVRHQVITGLGACKCLAPSHAPGRGPSSEDSPLQEHLSPEATSRNPLKHRLTGRNRRRREGASTHPGRKMWPKKPSGRQSPDGPSGRPLMPGTPPGPPGTVAGQIDPPHQPPR